MRVVRIFIMVARCSKCDFQNLGIIWDRNRWSEIFVSENVSSEKSECFFLSENFSSKKKSENFWSNFFWDQKISIFVRKKFVEKVNENSKFWNFDFFRKIFKISKFWIFIDFFNDFFFGQTSKFVGPQFFSTRCFRIFFARKFFDRTISDYLFRSQMISRFRKSHLEQRPSIIKIRTARTKK